MRANWVCTTLLLLRPSILVFGLLSLLPASLKAADAPFETERQSLKELMGDVLSDNQMKEQVMAHVRRVVDHAKDHAESSFQKGLLRLYSHFDCAGTPVVVFDQLGPCFAIVPLLSKGIAVAKVKINPFTGDIVSFPDADSAYRPRYSIKIDSWERFVSHASVQEPQLRAEARYIQVAINNKKVLYEAMPSGSPETSAGSTLCNTSTILRRTVSYPFGPPQPIEPIPPPTGTIVAGRPGRKPVQAKYVSVESPWPDWSDYEIPEKDSLPWKDQDPTQDWVLYVNDHFNPQHRHPFAFDGWEFDGTTTLKCLSYAASTICDWFRLRKGIALGSYQSYIHGSGVTGQGDFENGLSPRELELQYTHLYEAHLYEESKPEGFDCLVTADPTTDDWVPVDLVGYCRLLTKDIEYSMDNDYDYIFGQHPSPSPWVYSTSPDYHCGDDYQELPPQPTPDDADAYRQALQSNGILYVKVDSDRWLPFIFHSMAAVGIGMLDGQPTLISHNSYGSPSQGRPDAGYKWNALNGGGLFSEGVLQAFTFPDTTPPMVSITSPGDGATVSGIVQVSSEVTDNLGAISTEDITLYVQGGHIPVTPTYTAPSTYTFEWDSTGTSNGLRSVVVEARDSAGNWNFDDIYVNVQNHAGALSSSHVEPPSGDTNTTFQFSVIFTDADNDPPDPDSVKFVLNGQEYVMTTTDTDYSDGSVFVYPAAGGMQLGQGSHSYHFEALQGGQHVQGSPTGALTLNVPPPWPGQVTVQLSPNPVDVFQTTTVTATVKDSSGSPLQGATVEFSPNGFPGVMSPTSDQTDANGRATATFEPHASGVALITARVSGGGPVGSAYLTVTGSITFQLFISPAGGTAYELQAKLFNDGVAWPNQDVTLTLSPASMANFNRTNDATFSTDTNGAGYAQDPPGGGSSVVDFTTTGYGELTITAEHDSTGAASSTKLIIWEPGTETTFAPLKDLGYSGVDVDWNGDGHLIAITGVAGGTVLIEEPLGTGNLWKTINLDNRGANRGVVFSPDYNELLIVGEGNADEMAIMTLNYPDGTPSKRCSLNHHGLPEARACDWGGSKILVGRTNDSECEVYNSNPCLGTACPINMPDDVNAVAFDKSNPSRFILGDWDGNIKAANTSCSTLWDGDFIDAHVTSAGWYGNYALVGDENGAIYRYGASGGSPSVYSHGTSDVTCLEFSPNGQWLASCGGGGIWIWRTSSWTPMYTGPGATCVAWDPTSNYLVDNNGKLYAPFDHTPPLISISSPPDGLQTYDTTVDVTGTVTDPLGISSATISVNGGTSEDLALGDQGDFSHGVSLVVGANTIRVEATDGGGAGGYAQISVTRNTDTEGPVISNVTVSPAQGTIGSAFTISAHVADGISDVNPNSVTCHAQLPDETDAGTLQMYDDGTHGDTSGGDSVYMCQWDSTGAQEGTHFVDITASDVPGNPSEAENAQTFVAYDLPLFGTPVIAPSSPTDTDDVSVTIGITDQSGIASATLWYQPPSSSTWVPRQLTADGQAHTGTIPPQNDGTVNYKVEATDSFGYSGQTGPYSYNVVDASPPVAWNWTRTPWNITTLTTGTALVSVKVADVGGSGLVGAPQFDYRLSDGAFDGWETMGAGGDAWTFEIPDLGWSVSGGKSLQYKVRALDNRDNELVTPIENELIEEVNLSPTAVITSVMPSPADPITDTVSFRDGSYDNDEGGESIVAWEWRSDLGDWQGNTVISNEREPSISANDFQVGTHTITLTVLDDEGGSDATEQSDPLAERPFTLVVSNVPPVIVTSTVEPRRVEDHQISITGTAHDGDEHEQSIVGWQITITGPGGFSQIETAGAGELSLAIETATFPTGEYSVSMRAQDDDGAWSDPSVSAFGITIAGDVNFDCIVNVLDMINVRNHLYDDVGSGDNWRYDLTGDGMISVLDMIVVRNNVRNRCP